MALYDEKNDRTYYDPEQVSAKFVAFGISVMGDEHEELNLDFPIQEDERLTLTEKVLRRFLKATQLNENIFRLKLGRQYSYFEEDVLPRLLDAGIMSQVEYIGSGAQRRFKISKPMTMLDRAMASANGNFDVFIEEAKR